MIMFGSVSIHSVNFAYNKRENISVSCEPLSMYLYICKKLKLLKLPQFSTSAQH